jgi:PAS domain S-box-containing protein
MFYSLRSLLPLEATASGIARRVRFTDCLGILFDFHDADLLHSQTTRVTLFRDCPHFWGIILACGTTHIVAVWTLWHPDYWLFGGIKLITALVSLYTAIELLTLIPTVLALPSPAQQEATHQKLAQEILDRISAEAALKQSESRFRLIFEDAAIGMALAGITGQLVATNPAFQRMLGYSQNELSGMHFKEFTHADCIAVEETLFEEMVAGQRDFYQLEKRYISKGEQLIWVHLTVSLVRDAEGKPEFCIALTENITERKQAEASLRLYQEHLEELVVARTAELVKAMNNSLGKLVTMPSRV